MSNYFRLVKIGLMNNLITRTKSKKDIALIIFGTIVLVLSFFGLFKGLLMFAKGLETIILLLAFMGFALLTIFTSINGASTYLFNFKDYDFVMSLPVSKFWIILSRITIVYINDLIAMIIFLTPLLIAYFTTVSVSLETVIIIKLILLFLPVVPMVIGSVLSVIVTYVTSFFKSNKFIQLLANLSFIGIYLYFYYKLTNYKPDLTQITSILNLLTDTINSKYPLARYYTEALMDKNYLSLLIYVVISIVILVVFTAILQMIYLKLNTFLKIERNKTNYKYKSEKTTQFKSLVTKEYKKLLSSPIYLINSLFSLMLLLIMAGYLLFSDGGAVVSAISKELEIKSFFGVLPLVLAMGAGMSCLTHSSISLEGRSIWLLKTMPIKTKTYFDSKIIFNLVINVVVLVIAVTAINYSFKLNMALSIYNYLIPILFSLFIMIIALILNLKFPKFIYDNDAQVVKQSIPSFAYTMIAMFIPLILLKVIDGAKNIYMSLFVITISIALATLLAYIFLNIYGAKRFKQF